MPKLHSEPHRQIRLGEQSRPRGRLFVNLRGYRDGPVDAASRSRLPRTRLPRSVNAVVVNELPPRLEAVTPDPFIDDLPALTPQSTPVHAPGRRSPAVSSPVPKTQPRGQRRD